MMKKEYLEEKQFLEQYDSSAFEKPSVAVDVLIFTIEDDELKIVMIERNEFPYRGCLALPGVFVGVEESLEDAAIRGMKVETGLTDIYLEQLYTWGDVGRDPRMRIISVSYLTLVSIDQLCAKAGNGNIREYLYPVKQVLSDESDIAFDHKKIISYARERIQNKVEYSDIAFNFVPEKFTLPRLQKVYEILLGKEVYKANFRKKVSHMVKETDEYTSGGACRPSKLYIREDSL